ncbi:MAG: tRNA (N6-isopentenyl adenosine(37)-C2)-methylthiotransferase MiaB [Oligoflexia bacterium]|nr:tRNA (N6-isopentenyl adenosine(37)-C2)-methylthiotransferase MiaB [Oligoflexia bacterium]
MLTAPQAVFITTYGCQMNEHDTERMFSILEVHNYYQVTAPEDADVIIINSCSVREKPVHKVLSEIGTYKTLKAQKPHLKIGVGGCVGQQEGKKLLSKVQNLDFVFGTDTIDLLPQIIQEAQSKKNVVQTKMDHRGPYTIETMVRNTKVSAFVTITKGCDNFCSFCVVPFTRGRERSRLLSETVKDVQNLVARGVKEITLLGQNVNSYKSPDGAGDFSDLLNTICEQTELKRLRYTTSHPKDFDDKVIQAHIKHVEKLGLYLHLPVQSGSTRVLSAMNRGYTREEYLAKVLKIKKALPEIVLSTDVIVGFPTETDSEFEETLSLVRELEFENVYSFKYSPRPFTKALKYTAEEQVSEDVKDKRLYKLMDVQEEIGFKKAQTYENKTYDILVEGPSRANPQVLTGRTVHNKVVNFLGDSNLIGEIIPVKMIKSQPFSMRGEILN